MAASGIKPFLQTAIGTALTEPIDGVAINEYIAAMARELSQMALDAGDRGLALTLQAASVQAEQNAAL